MASRFFVACARSFVGGHRHFRNRSAQDRSIVVASTTSTQDSGLFGYLLPIFKAKTASR